MQHPRTIQLIMDSLRYWVTDMHVDGFRFDLAPVLARELHDVDKLSAFFDIIHQDPTLAQREADRRAVGRRARRLSGRQLSRFAGRSGTASIATPCATSGAAITGRCPSSRRASPARATSTSRAAAASYASVNFITAHDGYTLHDLVSYEQKHNEANGEDNRDGHNDNISRNWGVEGRRPTIRRSSTLRYRDDARLHRDARVLAGRADARRTATRSRARSTATTTRTRRTTRSRG